jgi:hypothetical protein
MLKISRIKDLAAKLYSGALRSDSHYAFAVRQHRETSLRKELAEDPKLLTPYGWSGYSQNDEDGIIQEIFSRIGTTTRRFVEFGAGDPLCNTGTYLLLSGWSGEWIDASGHEMEAIRTQFKAWIESKHLIATHTFITPENINSLVKPSPVIDLLVIDIDGNDFHIWDALEAQPRVLMIEYNATFRPPVALTQPYVKEPFWNGENFYGASLKAFEHLATKKGYCLVGCNFAGTNAFFVRADLVGDHFSPPYAAEHHFREQWIDGMSCGYARQVRSAGPGIRYNYLGEDKNKTTLPPA